MLGSGALRAMSHARQSRQVRPVAVQGETGEPSLVALFTFVARDSLTGRAMAITAWSQSQRLTERALLKGNRLRSSGGLPARRPQPRSHQMSYHCCGCS